MLQSVMMNAGMSELVNFLSVLTRRDLCQNIRINIIPAWV